MSGTLLSCFFFFTYFRLSLACFFQCYLLRNDNMSLDSRLHLFTGCSCDLHFLSVFPISDFCLHWIIFQRGQSSVQEELPLCGCLLTGALNPCCKVEGHSVPFLFMFLNATWPLDPLDPFPSRPLGYSINPGFDQDEWKRTSPFHLDKG